MLRPWSTKDGNKEETKVDTREVHPDKIAPPQKMSIFLLTNGATEGSEIAPGWCWHSLNCGINHRPVGIFPNVEALLARLTLNLGDPISLEASGNGL